MEAISGYPQRRSSATVVPAYDPQQLTAAVRSIERRNQAVSQQFDAIMAQVALADKRSPKWSMSGVMWKTCMFVCCHWKLWACFWPGVYVLLCLFCAAGHQTSCDCKGTMEFTAALMAGREFMKMNPFSGLNWMKPAAEPVKDKEQSTTESDPKDSTQDCCGDEVGLSKLQREQVGEIAEKVHGAGTKLSEQTGDNGLSDLQARQVEEMFTKFHELVSNGGLNAIMKGQVRAVAMEEGWIAQSRFFKRLDSIEHTTATRVNDVHAVYLTWLCSLSCGVVFLACLQILNWSNVVCLAGDVGRMVTKVTCLNSRVDKLASEFIILTGSHHARAPAGPGTEPSSEGAGQ